MQTTPLKHLTALILIASLAGCASTPRTTSQAKHQMELEDAFRARGLYLSESGDLLSLQELCSDWKLNSTAGRNCMAQSSNAVFRPTIQASELISNPSLAMLVKALPKDADFTVLPLQKELLAKGLYQTWAGENRPYAEAGELQAKQQGNRYQVFDGTLPESATGTLNLMNDRVILR